MSYFGLYLDYRYPSGGTGALADKVTESILKNGGEILTGDAVCRVDARRREAVSVSGRTYRYRTLIWAADQKMLYEALETPKSRAVDTRRTLAARATGGDSVLSLFIGADIAPAFFAKSCGAHAFYTPVLDGLSSLPDWCEAASDVEEMLRWVGDYLSRTTYEISCPSLRDETLAPTGKTGVIVSTLMDYRLVRRFSDAGAYEAFKDFCAEKIIGVLNATIFPGLRDSTEFVLCATPMTIERETGNAEGAITGWAFTNGTMPAENRFRKISKSIRTPVPDIFQCGQWSFSPSGLPVSILTGKLAADAARKCLGKKGAAL